MCLFWKYINQRKFEDKSLLPVFPFCKERSTNKEVGDLYVMSDKGKEWSQPLFGCFDDVTTCKLPCFMLYSEGLLT